MAKRSTRSRQTSGARRPPSRKRRGTSPEESKPLQEEEKREPEPQTVVEIEAPSAPPQPLLSRDAGFGEGILEPGTVFRSQIEDEKAESESAIQAPAGVKEPESFPDARDIRQRDGAFGDGGRQARSRPPHEEWQAGVDAPVRPTRQDFLTKAPTDVAEALPAAREVKADHHDDMDGSSEGSPRSGSRTRTPPRRRGRKAAGRDVVGLGERQREMEITRPPVEVGALARASAVTARNESFPETIDFEEVDEEADDDADVLEVSPTAEPEQPASRPRGKAARPLERTSTERSEMLINVSDTDECRIALLSGGRLEELYIERATATSNVGNIYKGRVTNVEPSIQAAFVDFGLPAHGFLHISDLHPKYFPESKGEPEVVGKKTPRRHRPPIQSCLRRGQEIIVQVIKEGIGTKGPTLSSYVSLPGRFLVMMPDMEQLGVSRKIEDEEHRRKLREILGQLSLPKDMGFIVRTAGVERNKRDLQRDLNYLTRLWRKVAVRIRSEPAPAELYKESDLVIRTIRDVYDSSLSRIVVDSPAVAARVRDFLAIASPRSQDVVVEYTDFEPLFHNQGIESEIDKLSSKEVPLPCGGTLVIEPTEALVAIDVNSGRFRVAENPEETAYRVNLEAVDEIARQLRLRDLGGLIICDLIDMTQDRHRRAVERRLAEALKKHKERAKILRISRFGILEMTRQRQRPSFAKSIFRDCPRCNGSGRVKTPESASLDVMRQIRLASHRSGVASIDVSLSPSVAHDLLNRKRHQLTDLERATSQTIRIHAKEELNIDEVQLSCTDRRGREAAAPAAPPNTGRNPPPRRPPERPASTVGNSRPGGPPARPPQFNQGADSNNRRRSGRRRGRRRGR